MVKDVRNLLSLNTKKNKEQLIYLVNTLMLSCHVMDQTTQKSHQEYRRRI